MLFILTSMVIYILGYKHNQITFFLQTLAFIGFILKDNQLQLSIFLYNLKYSYYNFGVALY
jgi:hypothetical protein